MPFDVFICYKRNSGEDLAEHLKAGLEEWGIHAFLDTKDINEKFKGTEDWTKTRDRAVIESKRFLLVITAGFELSPEIKKELSLAREYANKEFVYFRHKDLKPNLKIILNNGELDLGKQQQTPFETKQELLRKAHSILMESQKVYHTLDTALTGDRTFNHGAQEIKSMAPSAGQWDPLPAIRVNVTQTPLGSSQIRQMPQVGWELFNDSSYQLKIRIEVHPILGGRDLHPLSDNDMNGTKRYFVEPHAAAFGNGLFSLPIECARSGEELILEMRSSAEDFNEPQKGEYKFVPKWWKYMRKENQWSYYPQGP
jgi:hypothetical protein